MVDRGVPRLLAGDLNTPRYESREGEIVTFARDRKGRIRDVGAGRGGVSEWLAFRAGGCLGGGGTRSTFAAAMAVNVEPVGVSMANRVGQILPCVAA